MIDMNVDIRGFANIEEMLKAYPTQAKRALVRTTNRNLTTTKKLVSQEVKKEYKGLKTKDIKTKIKVKRANFSNMTGEIDYASSRLRMGLFPHTKSSVRPPRPVSVTIKTKSKLPNNYFTATSRVTGKREVFRRKPKTEKGQYNIRYGMTIAYSQMVSGLTGETGAYPKIRDKVEEKFKKDLDHELWFQMERYKGNL